MLRLISEEWSEPGRTPVNREDSVQGLLDVWSRLKLRQKVIVGLATAAVFAAVLALSRLATATDLELLYSGLEPATAGEVLAALDQRAVAYEVRGSGIYVDAAQRDMLRLSLAGEGLPNSSGQGYELLDSLTGFGTTSEMFDASYWRAKEGELARTILANPQIRAARVHIASTIGRGFQRGLQPTAAVTVTTVAGGLAQPQVRALRYLVASAVAGMRPEDVSVIDDVSGLIDDASGAGQGGNGESRGEALQARAIRLLEARVGPGNAVVEVSVELETDVESVSERVIDPDSRVAISTEVQESTNSGENQDPGAVTVASNLPTGDAGGGSGSSRTAASETRSVTNYDISETTREIVRGAGAVRRMTVAILVNEVADPAGGAAQPRSGEELAALRDLVASAVGLDAGRGDQITIHALPFEPLPLSGTEAVARAPLDWMGLARIGALALVALVLGLFVVRPMLTGRRLPPLVNTPELVDARGSLAIAGSSVRPGQDQASAEPVEDPVERFRRLIDNRQADAARILQSWVEDTDRQESA